MTFEHAWTPPTYERLLTAGVYVPVQECPRCGTRRNPITRKIVKYGSRACQLPDGSVADSPEYPEHYTRLREELDKLEAAGEDVVRYYDGTLPRPSPEAQAEAAGV